MTTYSSHLRRRRLATSVARATAAAAVASLTFAGTAAASTGPAAPPAPPAAVSAAPPAPVNAAPAPAGSAAATADRRAVPAIARAWADAWNSGDGEELAALFTRDGVYQDFAFGASFQGREGIASWVATTTASIDGVQVQITDAFRAGNRVSIRWTFSGHIIGAPAPFSVPAVTVMELQRGRISYDGDYYNLVDVLRQSGLPADPPAPAPAG